MVSPHVHYSDELAETICAQLVEGLSLRKICTAKGMPDRTTVLRWLGDNAAFAAKYARAREMQADYLFEQMQEVADTGNREDIQRARLRVDTMRWRAMKLAPKRYGEHVDIGVSGTLTLEALITESLAASDKPRE